MTQKLRDALSIWQKSGKSGRESTDKVIEALVEIALADSQEPETVERKTVKPQK